MPWANMPWMQQQGAAPMDNWMRSFGVYSPESSPDRSVMANMMSAANSFVNLSKEIFQALQKMGEGVQGGGDWTRALDLSIQQAKAAFMGQDAGKAAMNPMAAWGQPLQMWMGMLKDNPLFSSEVLQGMMSGMNRSNAWQQQGMGEEWMQQLLAMPGLGLNREKQERMQAGMRDALEYQRAFQAFQALSNQVNVQALDLLHKRLLERGATQKPIESMRDLYVLWVDCCEEVNAGFVRGKEYQQANSRMVNALVKVQSYTQTVMDEQLGALGMPTRKELNSAHRQVHELKRWVRALEEQVNGIHTQDHAAELRSIRDDLDRLDVRTLRQDLTDMKGLLEAVRPASSDQPEKKAASAARTRATAREKVGTTAAATAARKGE
jgi:class III poly(R)-hydroxyalkanoic acid synthase PhaE subunit